MAQPYLGEIRMFAGNFAPAGWSFCEGQLLPISENDALFQLIGTTYGGNGTTDFALPDLRGRLPIHPGMGPDGTTYGLAVQGGQEQVTLSVQQIPVHTHPILGDQQPATSAQPQGRVLAETELDLYGVPGGPTVTLSPYVMTPVGGSQPHDNFHPYLCVNFIISLFGIFPSQN